MSYSVAAQVAEARHWADIGYHEGANNANIFSFWQYGSYNNPWCDSFVCYCACMGGFVFPPYSACGAKGDYNVGAHHQHAIREGIWRAPSERAHAGWLVVLSFTEADQHIEMVLADNGGNLATIGGNTSDRVAYRVRYRSNVVGFIALDEAGQSTSTPVVITPTAPPVPVEPVKTATGGLIVDLSHAVVKTISLSHRGFGCFEGALDIGRQVAECVATPLGPNPETDGWWAGQLERNVRAQIRGTKVVVTDFLPKFTAADTAPQVHVLAIPA